VIFSYPLAFDAPLAVRYVAYPFGTDKLKWWGYPMVKINWGYARYKSPFFQPISRFISEIMQDRAIVTMESKQETAPKLSNGISFNDLKWSLSQISKSRYYSTSNNSKRYKMELYNGRPIESHVWSIERRHFQWPWTTPNPNFKQFKVTSLFNDKYLRNAFTTVRFLWT